MRELGKDFIMYAYRNWTPLYRRCTDIGLPPIQPYTRCQCKMLTFVKLGWGTGGHFLGSFGLFHKSEFKNKN